VEGNRVIGSDCVDSSTPGVFALTESAGEASLERGVLIVVRKLAVIVSSMARPLLASRDCVLLVRAGRSPSVDAMAVNEDLRAWPLSCSDSPMNNQDTSQGGANRVDYLV
jgi:hypothetical protein